MINNLINWIRRLFRKGDVIFDRFSHPSDVTVKIIVGFNVQANKMWVKSCGNCTANDLGLIVAHLMAMSVRLAPASKDDVFGAIRHAAEESLRATEVKQVT